MSLDILLYCPDHHIAYNRHTLDYVGVGGGITARLMLAHALAKLGHKVSLYVNCPYEEILDGVRYRHYSHLENPTVDIAIFSSSAGSLNVDMDQQLHNIHARIKILMVHGVDLPAYVNPNEFDFIYAPSNFIRNIAITNWKIDQRKIFVIYHGIEFDNKTFNLSGKRNLFNLVYFGHPSKGLDTAIQIFRNLYNIDSRFSLHIFGGNQLWGEKEEEIPIEPNLIYHGLVGQKELNHRLPEMSFSLNLQSRPEPFGLVIPQSMRAGCIVLGSPVGAIPELIKDGFNGFLIPGIHTDSVVHQFASNLILDLLQSPEYMNFIRRNAVSSPFSWDTIARTCNDHWSWVLKEGYFNQDNSTFLSKCFYCQGNCLPLADGMHCLECGKYQNSLIQVQQAISVG